MNTISEASRLSQLAIYVSLFIIFFLFASLSMIDFNRRMGKSKILSAFFCVLGFLFFGAGLLVMIPLLPRNMISEGKVIVAIIITSAMILSGISHIIISRIMKRKAKT